MITRALRSTLFEMRYADSLWSAVIVADMAAFDDLVSLDELWQYALAHGGMTGIPQARDAVRSGRREQLVAHGDGDAADLGVHCRAWPGRCTNQPIFDLHGRHIGTPDLLDIEAGVLGEYDSELHLDGKRRLKDTAREEAFRRLGLEPVVMVAGQGRDEVAARMIATRERATAERATTVSGPSSSRPGGPPPRPSPSAAPWPEHSGPACSTRRTA